MDPTMMQGAADAQPEDAGGPDQGYEICIKVDAQGGISVGVETDQDEAAEEQSGSEMSEDNYRPVKSIKEALSIALDIYRNAGQVATAAEDEQAGFNSVADQAGA